MVIPKNSPDPRGKKLFYWDITCNNYTEEDCELVKDVFEEICDAYVVGKEVGKECGTPHLQMMVKLLKGNYKSYLINRLSKQFSIRPGRNMEKLRDYCQKECLWIKKNVERIKNPVKKCKNVEEAGRKIRADIQHKRHEEIVRVMKELEMEDFDWKWDNDKIPLERVRMFNFEKTNGEIKKENEIIMFEDFVGYDWE